MTAQSFPRAYLELIALSDDAPADRFFSTADYGKVETLGPSLPPIKLPLPAASARAASRRLTVACKSIKPPYKFSTTLADVPDTRAVFELKADLVAAVEALRDAAPADLKLLLKGKVLQDTATLASVATGSELSLMCVVSRPAPAAAAADPAAADPAAADPAAADPAAAAAPAAAPPSSAVRDATWAQIESLLAADVGDAPASAAVKKFKAAWST
ncbi:Ubiquitin-like domain-containing protein [[Candida] zeylanoides]